MDRGGFLECTGWREPQNGLTFKECVLEEASSRNASYAKRKTRIASSSEGEEFLSLSCLSLPH